MSTFLVMCLLLLMPLLVFCADKLQDGDIGQYLQLVPLCPKVLGVALLPIGGEHHYSSCGVIQLLERRIALSPPFMPHEHVLLGDTAAGKVPLLAPLCGRHAPCVLVGIAS